MIETIDGVRRERGALDRQKVKAREGREGRKEGRGTNRIRHEVAAARAGVAGGKVREAKKEGKRGGE